MNYLCVCKCGAKGTIPGGFCPDLETGSLDLNDEKAEWEGGNPNCPHDDYEITDSEPDDYGLSISDYFGGN